LLGNVDWMTMKLSQNEKEVLLRLARQGLESAAHRRPLPDLDLSQLPQALQQPGASFVTLTKHEKLRGCIGTLSPDVALAQDVLQHGQDAAFDYRFSPVRPEELDDIHIEVSVLTQPQPLRYDTPEDLLDRLHPGRHGVVLRSGRQRATFLPQVWEKVPDKEEFLGMLCRKALLPADAWKQQAIEIDVYHVIQFEE